MPATAKDPLARLCCVYRCTDAIENFLIAPNRRQIEDLQRPSKTKKVTMTFDQTGYHCAAIQINYPGRIPNQAVYFLSGPHCENLMPLQRYSL
ncbi:MAG: hypothetical protein ACI9ON_002897 [Limisphaerales bacterium]|jgi:hypothetical protein